MILRYKNCLFGSGTLTKNANIDKYEYSGYGIYFDRKSSFSFPGDGFGENVIIFGVDMSSSAHFDDKKKNILVLGKGPTQGLEHTLTAEKIYLVNFTVTKKVFYLSLHYNEWNSYLFVNVKEIVKIKAKDSATVATPLCLGNISKDWSVNDMKKTGLNGYAYKFSVDYGPINPPLNVTKAVPILHDYFMTKYKLK